MAREYVANINTTDHINLIPLLDRSKNILIVGNIATGKTTLADKIVKYYLDKYYEIHMEKCDLEFLEEGNHIIIAHELPDDKTLCYIDTFIITSYNDVIALKLKEYYGVLLPYVELYKPWYMIWESFFTFTPKLIH